MDTVEPHDFKWEPYADFEREQRDELGGTPLNPNPKTIGVYLTDYVNANAYVTPDQARLLAMALEKAANAAEDKNVVLWDRGLL